MNFEGLAVFQIDLLFWSESSLPLLCVHWERGWGRDQECWWPSVFLGNNSCLKFREALLVCSVGHCRDSPFGMCVASQNEFMTATEFFWFLELANKVEMKWERDLYSKNSFPIILGKLSQSFRPHSSFGDWGGEGSIKCYSFKPLRKWVLSIWPSSIHPSIHPSSI